MKLQNQLTSVEISNKLHELGVRTPSIFYREWTGAKPKEIEQWENPDYCEDNVNCYSVAELGEMLPYFISIEVDYPTGLCNDNDKSVEQYSLYQMPPFSRIEDYCVGYSFPKENGMPNTLIEIQGETEADARGKMLIYLLENKLT